MSIVEQYIQISLNKANGNKTLAKKALLEAARKDADLAQQLVMPHLESIIAHAVDRYMRLGGIEDAPAAPVEEKPAEKKEAPPTEASDNHKAAVMQMIAAFKKRD